MNRLQTLLYSVALCMISICVNATPVLDQQNIVTELGIISGIGSTEKAQTFTAGISGQLSAIELDIQKEIESTYDLVVDIRPFINDEPSLDLSSNLASVVIPSNAISMTRSIHYVDLSTENINVNAGQKLAIVLRTNPAPDAAFVTAYSWFGEQGGGAGTDEDPYLPGTLLARNLFFGDGEWIHSDQEPAILYEDGVPYEVGISFDTGFATYITIPEPASLLLLSAITLVSCRRHTHI